MIVQSRVWSLVVPLSTFSCRRSLKVAKGRPWTCTRQLPWLAGVEPKVFFRKAGLKQCEKKAAPCVTMRWMGWQEEKSCGPATDSH